MQGRERVRQHLGGRGSDRPPLIAFANDFAARLEQVEPAQMWRDAGVLTRALTGLEALFGLDAVTVEVPAAGLVPDRLGVLADGLARVRTLLGNRAAVVLALPGPLTCAVDAGRDNSPETLEQLGTGILEAAKTLGPEHADCLAVIERVPVRGEDVQPLDDALVPLWNVARYYAAPSMLVVADGVSELADTSADALAVWTGASPHGLAAKGARHVGVPIDPPTAPAQAPALPELPVGGFYTTRGELAADTEIEWLHQVVAAVGKSR